MKPIRRAPSSGARWGAILAGLVALGTSGFYSWPALVVGGLGFAVLAIGLLRGSNANVTGGAFGLFVAAVLAGVGAGPIGPVLVSVIAAVLAWDYGGTAISIGNQLGTEAETGRIEAVHMGGSALVGTVTAGVGYGLYWAGSGGKPVTALVFFVLAAVFLVQSLR